MVHGLLLCFTGTGCSTSHSLAVYGCIKFALRTSKCPPSCSVALIRIQKKLTTLSPSCSCPSENVRTLTCRSNHPQTLDRVEAISNDQTSCYLQASSVVFGDPCPVTFNFLKVLYTCKNANDRGRDNILWRGWVLQLHHSWYYSKEQFAIWIIIE